MKKASNALKTTIFLTLALCLAAAAAATDVHIESGDTPTLRLEQDSSSGSTPQIWDVAGDEDNFFIRDVTNGSTLPFHIRRGAPSSSIFIDVDGDVGIGDSSPDASLKVQRSDNTAQILVEDTGTRAQDLLLLKNAGPSRLALQNTASTGGSDTWRFKHANSGKLRIAVDDGDVELILTQDGDLTITGGLVTTGGGGACTVADPCDGVFHPDFEVPSIEEHAAFMWENSYLPAVGSTPEGGPINITQKTGGILNELEKAHIYIEQLHRTMMAQQDAIGDLTRRLEQLESDE